MLYYFLVVGDIAANDPRWETNEWETVALEDPGNLFKFAVDKGPLGYSSHSGQTRTIIIPWNSFRISSAHHEDCQSTRMTIFRPRPLFAKNNQVDFPLFWVQTRNAKSIYILGNRKSTPRAGKAPATIHWSGRCSVVKLSWVSLSKRFTEVSIQSCDKHYFKYIATNTLLVMVWWFGLHWMFTSVSPIRQ